MDKDEIARAAAEEAARQSGRSDKERLRQERLVAFADASPSRVRITRDDQGTVVEIAPLSFAAQLRCLEADMIWMGLMLGAFIIAPAVGLGVAVVPGPGWLGGSIGAVAMVGFVVLAWYLRASTAKPFTLHVTPDGHVALWRNRARTRKPTWLGSPGSYDIHLEQFGTLHNRTGSPERRYGWGWLMVVPPGRSPINAGLPYYVNRADHDQIREALEPLGVLRK